MARRAARPGPPFRWQLLTGLIALFSLAACGTSGIIDTKPQTHVAISEPQNYNLPFASYLIGIEKASKKAVGEFNRLQCHAGEDYCFDIRQLHGQAFKEARDDLDDRRVEFVSHILRYEGPPLTPPAPVVPIYTIYPAAPASIGTGATGSYVEASWDALVGDFARDLRRRVSEERVTHILVFSTGWNTLQAASFANYRDWWSEILAEHDRICGTPTAPACGDSGLLGFRPLFVGITWDSDWPRAAVLGVEDYPNKASDADEMAGHSTVDRESRRGADLPRYSRSL